MGGIEELGGSGWRGSIRLVKLVWLVLPKKLGIGPKGPIYSDLWELLTLVVGTSILQVSFETG